MYMYFIRTLTLLFTLHTVQARRISKSIPESINFSYRGSVVTTTTIDGNVVEYNDTNLVKNNEDHVDSNYNGNIFMYIYIYTYICPCIYVYIYIYMSIQLYNIIIPYVFHSFIYLGLGLMPRRLSSELVTALNWQAVLRCVLLRLPPAR